MHNFWNIWCVKWFLRFSVTGVASAFISLFGHLSELRWLMLMGGGMFVFFWIAAVSMLPFIFWHRLKRL
jgi:hypothetical protein